MDDDLRRQIGELFGDAPAAPKPPTPATRSQQLRVAREQELARLARQDRAVAEIRALAAAAGVEITISVPLSPLHSQEVSVGRRSRRGA